MRTSKDEEITGAHSHARTGASPRPRNFVVQYVAGALALALTSFCLLCIIFFTTAAQASVGSGYHTAQTPLVITPTDTSTPSPTVTNTPSPTVTTTPSPTVTNTPTVTSTPSPTVTNTPTPTVTSTTYPYPTAPTTTPAPSPSVTHNIFPSPTSASTVGAKTSPTVVASPTSGATPTGTNTNTRGTGTNQGQGGSLTPASNSGDTSSSGTNPLADALPFILIGLGVIALLALLFIPARIILRKRMVPLPSPKLPPSGAAPWSRTSASFQPDQPFPFTQQSNGLYPQSFPAPPVVPTTNGYVGLTQSQQPFPTTPPLIPKVQAGYGGNQPAQTTSPAPPDNPFAGMHQPFDSSYPGARKRLRRNGLRATSDKIAIPEQLSGKLSADMMVISDPYLRSMLKQYSQNGQTTKQTPEETS